VPGLGTPAGARCAHTLSPCARGHARAPHRAGVPRGGGGKGASFKAYVTGHYSCKEVLSKERKGSRRCCLRKGKEAEGVWAAPGARPVGPRPGVL
jgi:hypothetical protein